MRRSHAPPVTGTATAVTLAVSATRVSNPNTPGLATPRQFPTWSRPRREEGKEKGRTGEFPTCWRRDISPGLSKAYRWQGANFARRVSGLSKPRPYISPPSGAHDPTKSPPRNTTPWIDLNLKFYIFFPTLSIIVLISNFPPRRFADRRAAIRDAPRWKMTHTGPPSPRGSGRSHSFLIRGQRPTLSQSVHNAHLTVQCKVLTNYLRRFHVYTWPLSPVILRVVLPAISRALRSMRWNGSCLV